MEPQTDQMLPPGAVISGFMVSAPLPPQELKSLMFWNSLVGVPMLETERESLMVSLPSK